MAKKKQPDTSLIAQNKKARFDYELLDKYEAGLVLTGSEVKSLREGHGNITEAYAIFQGDEIFLLNGYIAEYKNGGYAQHEERRTRKLLMHKKEIQNLKEEKERNSLTIITTKLYWANGKVKIEIAVARGKKQHDKRQTEKSRDWNRQKARLLKN